LKQTRGRWIDLFADYGAGTKIVYIEPRLETVLKQNKARKAAVPEGVIRKLAEKCEPPTWAECHRLIITDGNKEY
jgi:predicted kinase